MFFFPSKEDSFILGHWMIGSTCHVINRKGIKVILDFLSMELELQKSPISRGGELVIIKTHGGHLPKGQTRPNHREVTRTFP